MPYDPEAVEQKKDALVADFEVIRASGGIYSVEVTDGSNGPPLRVAILYPNGTLSLRNMCDDKAVPYHRKLRALFASDGPIPLVKSDNGGNIIRY